MFVNADLREAVGRVSLVTHRIAEVRLLMLDPGFCDTCASKVEILVLVFSEKIWEVLSPDLTDITNENMTEAIVNAVHLKLVVVVVDMLLHLRSANCL